MKKYSSNSASFDQADVELAPLDDGDLETISGGYTESADGHVTYTSDEENLHQK